MNSSVTRLSETSVMSISCFEMSDRRRSNGPLKLLRLTEKPAGSSVRPAASATPAAAATGASTASLGAVSVTSSSAAALCDGATGDQLSRELAIGLGCGRGRRKHGERLPCDTRVGKLHGSTDHTL